MFVNAKSNEEQEIFDFASLFDSVNNDTFADSINKILDNYEETHAENTSLANALLQDIRYIGNQVLNIYNNSGVLYPKMDQISEFLDVIEYNTRGNANFADKLVYIVSKLQYDETYQTKLLEIIARNGGGGGGGSDILSFGIAVATLAVSAAALTVPEVSVPTAVSIAAGGFGVGAIFEWIIQLLEPEVEREVREAQKDAKRETFSESYTGRYVSDDEADRYRESNAMQARIWQDLAEIYHSDKNEPEDKIIYFLMPGGDPSIEPDPEAARILLDPTSHTAGNYGYYAPKVEGAVRTGYNDIQTRQETLMKVEATYAPANYPAPVINMHGLEIHKEVDADEVFRRLNEALLKALNGPMLPSGFRAYTT